MTPFAQFHFLRPYWLLALVLLALLVWMMVKRRLGSRNWESVCDEALLPYVLIGRTRASRRYPVIITAIAGLLAILALAGPTWERLPQPVFSKTSSLVIALDLSRSMDATDVTPSRLARARFKISDILNRREEGLTALLVYAGDAFTVTPLTDDVATIESQLKALTTEIMPVQGNRTGLALKLAADLLKQAGQRRGDILLLTDEINFKRTEEMAINLNREGYRLSILGIGTQHGVPVPLPDGSFLKDRRGEIVIPVLEEKPMKALAAAGGGRYLKMRVDDRDIETLSAMFSNPGFDGEIKTTEIKSDIWREQGPWLLLLLLPLTALLFRRGYLAVLIIFLLPYPESSQAFDWDSLWLRPDQRGQRAMEAGEQQRAAALFQDPAWKGVAQYQAGDFEAARQSLEKSADVESLYNRGNALARLGEYQSAIDTYKKVLEQAPEHKDALYNKALLEKLLQQQQQQQQQSNQNQQGQQEKQQNAQQQPQQQQSQQQQQQQQGQSQDQSQDKSKQARQTEGAQQPQTDNQQQPEQQRQQAQQARSEDGRDQEQAAHDHKTDDNKQEKRDQEETPQAQEQTANSEMTPPDEAQQAMEQWLRRIPDDPGGLLRRKFRYQYQQRAGQTEEEKSW